MNKYLLIIFSLCAIPTNKNNGDNIFNNQLMITNSYLYPLLCHCLFCVLSSIFTMCLEVENTSFFHSFLFVQFLRFAFSNRICTVFVVVVVVKSVFTSILKSTCFFCIFIHIIIIVVIVVIVSLFFISLFSCRWFRWTIFMLHT